MAYSRLESGIIRRKTKSDKAIQYSLELGYSLSCVFLLMFFTFTIAMIGHGIKNIPYQDKQTNHTATVLGLMVIISPILFGSTFMASCLA